MEPFNPQVHKLDHQAILRVCNLYDIPLAYLFLGAQQFFTQENFNAKVELDGQVLEFKTGAATVANAAPPTSVMA